LAAAGRRDAHAAAECRIDHREDARVTGPLQLAAAFGAAFLAGAVNSVAGGGTLISFPVLVWLGLPSVVANATSTMGIWPGSVGSLWGFRRELRRADRVMLLLVPPSLVGGALGAFLLRRTSPAAFDHLVPFLILFATVLFALRGAVQRWLKSREAREHRSRAWLVGAMLFQLAVGTYGGYFGAGASIIMLSALAILGMTDILEMNALTSLFAMCINGVAIVVFIAAGLIRWPFVLAMAAGALAGGYGAAGAARRVGAQVVRTFIIFVGGALTVIFFIRSFG
jgi:uncharacterized protein